MVAAWQEGLEPKLYLNAMARGEVFFVAERREDDGAEVLGFTSDYPISGAEHGVSAYVRGGAARQGIGSALLRLAETHAIQQGATTIRIEASLAAVAFYLANGYVETGRGDVRLPSGQPIACVFMTKDLRGARLDSASPEAVVREFWRLMATNDFASVTSVLAPEFIMEWPQSRERIRGAANFARMNSEYPTSGRWQFRLNRLVAQNDSVVTQVSITDGQQSAEPVSFFTVRDGRITHLVEYWPEPFAPAPNRAHLTEPME